METKICTKCNKELPTTPEYFNKNKCRKDGLQPYCNMCRKKYRKENAEALSIQDKKYREENKAEISKRRKNYREENADILKKRAKKYREENAEAIKLSKKECYEKNKESVKSRMKEWRMKNTEAKKRADREYRLENLEARRAYNKKYYRENAAAINQQMKEYKKEYYKNPESRELRRLRCQKRRSLQKNAPATLTVNQWKKCKTFFNHACAYCGKPSQKLHQEHFVPVTFGGNYTINNIIPACRTCNSSKQDKNFFTWYPQQSFYSKRRESKVLKYLNYINPGEQQTSIFEHI